MSTENVSAYSHEDFDLTSSITLSAELGYAKVNGGPTGSNPRSDANGKIHVYRDNAYLTPDTAARIEAAGVTFLPISRVNDEVGSNTYSSENTVWHAILGLKAAHGRTWKWDANYQFGQYTG